MPQDKKKLEKLLLFIEEVANEEGNVWFKNELKQRFSTNTNNYPQNELLAIVEDLKNTKEYLQRVDKKFKIEAISFYKNIADRSLRKVLALDYKEMKIALINNDILEYGRRMNLQLEKCFDAVIKKLNGWAIVAENSDYSEVNFTIGKYPNKIKVSESFFKPDYNDKTKRVKKELSEIDYKVKAMFCALYYQINFEKYWGNLLDIYFIRNKASHGLLSENDIVKLNRLTEKFPENSSFYQIMFSTFINSIVDLKVP
jgi:hypothetical protein